MNDETIKQVCSHFDIGTVLEVERVTEGALSNNYFITCDAGKYFLKQYRFVKLERVRGVHAAKKFFVDAGIPVVLPLAAKSGDTIVVDGEKMYSLFPFVVGRQYERGHLPDAAVDSMGTTLARLHLASRGKIPDIGLMRRYDMETRFDPEKVEDLRVRIKATGLATEFDRYALDWLEEKYLLAKNTVRVTEEQMGPRTILHGDFHDKNIFLEDDGRVKYVFDVELAQIGFRVVELVRAFDYSVFDGEYSDERFAMSMRMVRAYTALYPMTAAEIVSGVAEYFNKTVTSDWIEKIH